MKSFSTHGDEQPNAPCQTDVKEKANDADSPCGSPTVVHASAASMHAGLEKKVHGGVVVGSHDAGKMSYLEAVLDRSDKVGADCRMQ